MLILAAALATSGIALPVPKASGTTVDTFTQTTANNDGTGTNFWSNAANWSSNSVSAITDVAVIPAASGTTFYDADLLGISPTVLGVNLGSGSNIFNSGSAPEVLTISPGSSGYNSIISGNIGSTSGTLPGSSGGSGGLGSQVALTISGGNNIVSGQLFGNFTLVLDGGTTTLSNTNNTYNGGAEIASGPAAVARNDNALSSGSAGGISHAAFHHRQCDGRDRLPPCPPPAGGRII